MQLVVPSISSHPRKFHIKYKSGRHSLDTGKKVRPRTVPDSLLAAELLRSIQISSNFLFHPRVHFYFYFIFVNTPLFFFCLHFIFYLVSIIYLDLVYYHEKRPTMCLANLAGLSLI